MKNVIKDIEQNCKDLSISGIVNFLNSSRDFYYLSEYDREIYFFYQDLIKDNRSHRQARKITIEMFSLSDTKFKTAIRKYKRRKI